MYEVRHGRRENDSNRGGFLPGNMTANSLGFSLLLADLWMQEHQDSAEEARRSLSEGDKLKALSLAIWSRRAKERHEGLMSRIVFGG